MEEIRETIAPITEPAERPEWWENTSYEDAKAIIRSNMASMARDSVAIGYYLRSIRDKQQYLDGGYQSFDAFVQAEYSMSYSAASRLIGLCERFSRGGNSPVLADSYQGYSKSLLVEMLPMSDAQLEQVQPGMTVADVREIKREAREEAVPEPDPEPPAEEPEVVFQLAGEVEETIRQEVVERLEAVMPAPVFEVDEPHDGVWFARYLLENYWAEKMPETLAGLELGYAPGELAKKLQMEIAPNGYSGFGRLGFNVRFESYSAGVDCEVKGEKHHWTYIQLIKDLRAALPDVPKGQEEPVATSQLPVCVMGYAESGICGAAAYCGQPYRCCLQCDMDCNGRCGWIPAAEPKSDPKVAMSQNQEPDPRRNSAMESQARVCLSNLNVEIGAKAWPAALASARHLVHYLSLVVGEEE